MGRASDAAAYIEHGNVDSIGYHSSVVLHIKCGDGKLLCFYADINWSTAIFPTHI